MSKKHILMVSALVLMASVLQTCAVTFNEALQQGYYPTYYVIAGLKSSNQQQVIQHVLQDELIEAQAEDLQKWQAALKGVEVLVVDQNKPSEFVAGKIDNVTTVKRDINAPHGDLQLIITRTGMATPPIRFLANSGSVLINYAELAKNLKVNPEILENAVKQEVLPLLK